MEKIKVNRYTSEDNAGNDLIQAIVRRQQNQKTYASQSAVMRKVYPIFFLAGKIQQP